MQTCPSCESEFDAVPGDTICQRCVRFTPGGRVRQDAERRAAQQAGYEIRAEQIGIAGWEYKVVSRQCDSSGEPQYSTPSFPNDGEAWHRACVDNHIQA